MFEILRREEMANGTVVLNEISAQKIAAKAKPGQFVMLKANETGERIPLTMADTDPKKGTITIIYQVVGKSTALFKSLQVGERFQDVIGPLGQATHLEKLGNVACVGGGTGVAVLHPITRGLKEVGNHVIAIIGARTKDLLILEDKMKAASHELHVCTDDGSYGHHGFVTDVLKKILEAEGCQVGGRDWPCPYDEVPLQADQGIRGQDPRQPEHHHGGRYRHVRMLPRERERRDQIRLCGWARV